MIERGWTSKAELKTNIGRWVHLGQVLPFIHHFLSRLRFLLWHLEKKRQQKLNEQCIADLEFLQSALKQCRDGINMNTIAYRCLTHAYQSYLCPARIGGYSNKSFAWRYYLPQYLKFRASNNLLEHIAAIITPWVDIIAGHLTRGDCALLMSDITTSEGWLKKTNFIEDSKSPIQATIRLKVARLHASHYLSHKIREYSQWFRGADNQVANALSRDDNRTDKELTKILHLHCPSQVPPHFEIVPLPSKIVLWLTLLLLWLLPKPELAEEHRRTTLGCGPATPNTATAVGTIENGYVRNVPLPRIPRIQSTSQVASALTSRESHVTCYSRIGWIPTWSELICSPDGFGTILIVPFFPLVG